jgi:uncharacterized protein
MISIQQITLPITHQPDAIAEAISEILGITKEEANSYTITKRAIDSRKKRQMINFVYSVTISLDNEEAVLENEAVKNYTKHHRIEITEPYVYELPKPTKSTKEKKHVIVGAGPCGLFAGLILAKAGLKPLIIDRGKDVDKRIKDVNAFISTGKLNTESNIQFGEGGAGTFSDGKLNTLITNPRIKYIFEEMVKAGAPESILIDAQPHIGTDKIRNVAKNIRNQIIELGGEVRFDTKLTDIKAEKDKLESVTLNDDEEIKVDSLVLAIGYSARDTYKMLHKKELKMEQKPFSVGVRIEHKREMINRAQFDKFYNNKKLGSAKYKLVSHSDTNRSVYTFCMCPGGYVVPSNSERGTVVTNGMSEYAQDAKNSNSALLVNVGPEDFPSDHPLAGIQFQKELEEKAFELGGKNYNAPTQLVGDFLTNQPSTRIKGVTPSYKPGVKLTSLDGCLPKFVTNSLREALPKMDKKIEGFAKSDAVLTAVETRSSAPLRITRDPETLQTNIAGIYPAGEGGGHAGGIVSSAVDGIRVAEIITKNK